MRNKMMSPEDAIKDAESKGLSFGKKDVLKNDNLDKRFAKVRITTMIDLILKEKLKEEAELSGTKYQILLNDILKKYFDRKEDKKIEDRLEKVESALEKIMTKTG